MLTEYHGRHLATKADNTSPVLADFLSDHGGRDPYRLLVDLNRDLVPDLALAFKDDSGKVFHAYWFPGVSGGFSAPQELGSSEWLANGGILWIDNRLGLGELYSDVVFWYRWDSASRRLVMEKPIEAGVDSGE